MARAPSETIKPKQKYTKGPLPVPQTITMTFVPDWNQSELGTPDCPASLCILLGPANTLPHKAQWRFEFNIFSQANASKPNKNQNEEINLKGKRALLWYAGQPQDRSSLVLDKCRLSSTDDLLTHSVVVKSYGSETDPNALIWARKEVKVGQNCQDLSYLKVIQGHHYYFRITFCAGSRIAEKVGQEKWRPIMYLYSKELKEGVQSIKSARVFTNFSTTWEGGVEPEPYEGEVQKASKGTLGEQKEKVESNKISIAPGSGSAAAGTANGTGTIPASSPMLEKDWDRYRTQSKACHYELIDSNVTLAQLETLFNKHPIYALRLENGLDLKSFQTDLPLDNFLENFIKRGEFPLGDAIADVENKARIEMHVRNSLAAYASKQLLEFFSAINQLPGWLHFQNYMNNSEKYIELMKAEKNPVEMATLIKQKGPVLYSDVENSMDKGKNLMLRLFQRITWVMDKYSGTNKLFDPALCLKVIAVDRLWGYYARDFMEETGKKIKEMTDKNPQKWKEFCDLQRKNAQWPHSKLVRQEIERAGFVFRPTVIKRDRCICSTCGFEVFGWCSWHDPSSLHYSEKHKISTPVVNTNATVVNTQPGSGSAASGSGTSASASVEQIPLPELDLNAFETNLPWGTKVEQFNKRGEFPLGDAMNDVENKARIEAQVQNSPLNGASKLLLTFFSAVTQLPGWLHVQNYINNSESYVELLKAGKDEVVIAALIKSKGPILCSDVEILMEKGNNIMRWLLQRISWVMDKYTVASTPFDPDFCLKILAADHTWGAAASTFMKETELKITEMLTKNPSKFHAFRDSTRKGVAWPHSVLARQEIERAGFEFKPMMVKRDRCVCKTCGVEVSGWRSWHNPNFFHNSAKHKLSAENSNVPAVNAQPGSGSAASGIGIAASGSGSVAVGSGTAAVGTGSASRKRKPSLDSSSDPKVDKKSKPSDETSAPNAASKLDKPVARKPG